MNWTKEFDADLYQLLLADKDKAIRILSIGRGGNKPRKDLATWNEIRNYLGFFYESLFKITDSFPENVSKEDSLAVLSRFAEIYDESDDSNSWFEKITVLAVSLGYAAKPKDYKASPESYKGHVGDISMILRIAVTGKCASPDLYSVMNILGKAEVLKRLANAAESLNA